MSEYWISQGRRMCTYCKCWTADNKASINFHEQGKNHKENVKLKLDELRKKGIADAVKRETESSDMAQIEKAALESLKKDITENKGMCGAYGLTNDQVSAVNKNLSAQASSGHAAAVTKNSSSDDKLTENPASPSEEMFTDGDWTTAYNDEGHLYYWNTVTSETSWYPPNQKETETPESSHAGSDQSNVKKVVIPAARSAVTGYGQWETVETEDEPPIDDYDLPTDSKNMLTAPEDIPLPPEASVFAAEEAPTEPQVKFKTKRVSLGSSDKSTEPVAFKKRKVTKQRQARSNLDDDD